MLDVALPLVAVAGVVETGGELVAEFAPDTGAPAELPLRLLSATAAETVWPTLTLPDDRQALIQAINHSFTYLATPKAAEDYQNYPVPGITRDRVWHSLQRLRQLVATSPNNQAFQTALRQEFVLYTSIGSDGDGTVAYTGYFEPQYMASAVPTAEYRYP
ncbi:MltA domain-containing protein, partial [Nodosilinea sp. LEGE 07298]